MSTEKPIPIETDPEAIREKEKQDQLLHIEQIAKAKIEIEQMFMQMGLMGKSGNGG